MTLPALRTLADGARFVFQPGQKEVRFGRDATAPIRILDPRASRDHLRLRASASAATTHAKLNLQVKDLSQHGTSLNDAPLAPKQTWIDTKPTDVLRIGLATLAVEEASLSFCVSGVFDEAMRGTLAANFQTMGAAVQSNIDSHTTHLIMSSMRITHKFLCALSYGCAIVSPAWVEAAAEATRTGAPLPPIDAPGCEPVATSSSMASVNHTIRFERRRLLAGRRFCLLPGPGGSKRENACEILTLCGAAEVRDLPELDEASAAALVAGGWEFLLPDGIAHSDPAAVNVLRSKGALYDNSSVRLVLVEANSEKLAPIGGHAPAVQQAAVHASRDSTQLIFTEPASASHQHSGDEPPAVVVVSAPPRPATAPPERADRSSPHVQRAPTREEPPPRPSSPGWKTVPRQQAERPNDEMDRPLTSEGDGWTEEALELRSAAATATSAHSGKAFTRRRLGMNGGAASARVQLVATPLLNGTENTGAVKHELAPSRARADDAADAAIAEIMLTSNKRVRF